MTPREQLAKAMQKASSASCFGEEIQVAGQTVLAVLGAPQIGLEFLPGRTIKKVEFTALITKEQLPVKPEENTSVDARGFELRVGKSDDAHVSWRLHLIQRKA